MRKEKYTLTLSFIMALVFITLNSVSFISYSVAIHVVFIAWLFLCCIDYGRKLNDILSSPRYICLYVFLVYYFISMVIGTNIATGFSRTVSFMELFSPIFLFDLYRIDKWKFARPAMFFFIAIYLVNLYASIEMIDFMGDTGLRQTIQGDSDNKMRGAFAITYSFVILIPALCLLLFNRKRCEKLSTISFIFIIISVLAGLYVVLRSFFVTAIIVTVIGLILSLFYLKRGAFIKSTVTVALVAVLFVLGFSTLYSFVDSLGEGAAKEILPKMIEIKSVFSQDIQNAYDFNSRVNLGLSSWQTFVRNPIFGVAYMMTDYDSLYELGVGNHSQWLDMLAMYGLFSIFVFVFLWKSMTVQFRSNNKVTFISILMFIILGFLNPILMFIVVLTTFVVIPVLYDLIGF